MNEDILKELQNIRRDLRSVKRGQKLGDLTSVAVFLVGVGMTVMFYSANMLNEALNVKPRVEVAIIGVLAGILLMLVPFIVEATLKKK